MKPILEVRDLSYRYSIGTPFEHTALDHVSFSVRPGEFIGVIGHTGSGKSTLMQQLNGLLKPTSGQVLLDGEDIYRSELPDEGLIVMGNESRGISEAVRGELSRGLRIPSFGGSRAESLNVAIATAVTLSTFRGK